jgi:hypothetical protein
MKATLISIYLGGALHVGWAVFHLLFPKIFKWKTALASMDELNSRIYQVINLCLTFYFAVVAYLSFRFAPELLQPGLGRKLCTIFGAFWLLRLGLQFRFFRAAHPVSLILIVFFAFTMGAYFYPILHGVR